MKRNYSRPLVLTIILIVLSYSQLCFAWQGKLISVSDGDSIKVMHDTKEEEIRFYGIDCPEGEQDFGQEAKNLTSTLVVGRKIEVKPMDTDRYGRTVGLVYVDGILLNELIIQNGYAWVYHQYCKEKFCSQWKQLETQAQNQKKGLWNASVIIPPWEWRSAKREKARKETASETDPPEIIIGPKANTPSNDSWLDSLGKKLTPEPASSTQKLAKTSQFKCDGRTYCSQMTSCQEATFFINNCPGTKMDGDNDGVPCEKQWCH